MRTFALTVAVTVLAGCSDLTLSSTGTSPLASPSQGSPAPIPTGAPTRPATPLVVPSSAPMATPLALDGAEIPVSTAPGFQSSPTAAFNPSEGVFLVVWSDARADNADIYGQLVKADGTLVGRAIAIRVAPGEQHAPQVAFDASTGEFLALWCSDNETMSGKIWGQRIDGQGNLLGAGFQISTGAGDDRAPMLLFHPTSHEFLAAWIHRFDETSSGIVAQRLGHDGHPVGSRTLLSSATPSLVAGAANTVDGGYMLAWSTSPDHVMPESSGDIVAQRLDAGAALVGAATFVSTAPDTQKDPAIAFNSRAKEFLVAWTDHRNQKDEGQFLLTPHPLFYEVYAQRLDAKGGLIRGNFPVATAADSQQAPAVAYEPASDAYVIAWNTSNAKTMTGLLAQRLTAEGELVGDSTALTSHAAQPVYPQLAFDNVVGEFLVVWHDFRKGIIGAGYDTDVFARRFTLP